MEKSIQGKSILITGSSGFIGENYLKRIIKYNPKRIQLIDTQLPSPWQKKLMKENDFISFYQLDIRDIDSYTHQLDEVDLLVHFAAQPSVPISTELPYYDFSVNVDGSMKMLEFARKTGVNHFVFAASGGTIYGETDHIPTAETDRLNPISNYGASKAAFEMFLRSYAALYGMKTTSLRFGNIFGPGSTHGVMFDFFMKLKNDPTKLTILGDGSQTKSYLYIDDCINGFLIASGRGDEGFQEYNLSGNEAISVTQIAEYVAKTLELKPKFEYTGGDRGWKGDVRFGSLSTEKIEKIGWIQSTSFKDGVKYYMDSLSKVYSL